MSKTFYTLFIVSGIIIAVLLSAFTGSTDKITEATLGQKLFFDPILSADQTISCASCHKPEFAFADNQPFSDGVNHKKTARNTPSVMNMAMRDAFFWDGRANTLEEQVVGPIQNPNEMNLPFSDAVRRVKGSKIYQQLFRQVYHKLPDSASIVHAIASYERTLETDHTPSDRWLNDLPGAGLTAQQIRGRELFLSSRTKCFDCHFTPDFTSDEFKNIGLFDGMALNDSGRYLITKKAEDIGRFKIPGLRNVAVTAPYMHNGMFKTLREVIDYYDDPSKFVKHALHRDTVLPVRIGLTATEKDDLESYLQALTDDRFVSPRKN